jgi:hypothetical protein
MDTRSTRLSKSDRTLLALGMAEGNLLTPVQLQKAVFLLQKLLPPEIIDGDSYDFVPYNYGPFCAEVYDDAVSMKDEDLVEVSRLPGRDYLVYAATSVGVDRSAGIAARLPDAVAQHAQTIVAWVRRQSFSSLVRAIYERYPEYRANSIFQG